MEKLFLSHVKEYYFLQYENYFQLGKKIHFINLEMSRSQISVLQEHVRYQYIPSDIAASAILSSSRFLIIQREAPPTSPTILKDGT